MLTVFFDQINVGLVHMDISIAKSYRPQSFER